MKHMLAATILALSLNSCVFDLPFEPSAKVAVDAALPGLWQETATDPQRQPNRLLVLKHSENEYLVQYPVGEKTMFFRAFPIDLAGERYIQLQLIGSEKGPVKPADRKYHLMKTRIDGDMLEVLAIDPDVLGKDATSTQQLREAFTLKKEDPKLFGDPMRFRRL